MHKPAESTVATGGPLLLPGHRPVDRQVKQWYGVAQGTVQNGGPNVRSLLIRPFERQRASSPKRCNGDVGLGDNPLFGFAAEQRKLVRAAIVKDVSASGSRHTVSQRTTPNDG